MALYAFIAAFMSSVFDTKQLTSSTIGVFEPGMTPKAEFPACVEGKKLFVIRVINGWAMTVFTFDRFMGRRIEHQHVFFMTFNTGLSSPVLNGKVFPFLYVAQAMIAIGEVPAVNSEVIGNQELSGHKDQTDQTDCDPQWAQDMPLHRHLPRRSERTEKVYELKRR